MSPINSNLKISPFYKNNPGIWFRQLDAAFSLAGITQPKTKFLHLITLLPEEVACRVDHIEEYDDLKNAVLDAVTANKHQLLQEAFTAVSLDGKRPTQLAAEIKQKFREVGLQDDDIVIKSKLITAFPSSLRAALVGHDDLPLESFVKVADSMLAVTQTAQPSNPFQIAPINQKIQNESLQRHTIRPFHSNQRPVVCNAHIFYGDRARTCRHWCRWPNKPKKILAQNFPTPSQSRSNSPEPSN